MSSLEEVFAPGGLLAAAIAGYRRRADQVEMAQAIGEAIESTGVLVAEAGTGTGKTFAYLVSALLAGGAALDRSIDAILAAFSGGPFIFNLGHGVLPETPLSHVERLVERVRRAAASS